MRTIVDPRVIDVDPGRVAVPAGRGRGLTVGDVMGPARVTLPRDADVLEVAGHLVDHGRSEVVIVSAEGPLGVITARDLARRWAGDADALTRAAAESLLPGRPRRLLPGLGIAAAAAVLVDEEVEALPVVDSYGDLVGVLGTRHILALVAAGRATF